MGGEGIHGVAGTSSGGCEWFCFEIMRMTAFLLALFTKSLDPLGTRAVALASRVQVFSGNTRTGRN